MEGLREKLGVPNRDPHVTTDSDVLGHKALSLYGDVSKGCPGARDTKSLTPSRRWFHRFRNRFGTKAIKMTGESASADEEAAAPFPVELKLIRVWYHPRFQTSTGGLRMYPHGQGRVTILYVYAITLAGWDRK